MGIDQDKLFLEGVPLDGDQDFVVKAQFKLPARDFAHPVVAHIFQEMRDCYLRHLNRLEEGIVEVLERAREMDKSILITVPVDRGSLLLKAGKAGKAPAAPKAPKAPKAPGATPPSVQARAPGKPRDVKNPGARGGKFYRTKSGKIIYGTQPNPQMHEREATDQEVAEHVQKFVSPTIFLGHDEKTMEAMHDSGAFDDDEIAMIETLRENLFKPTLEENGIEDDAETDAFTKFNNAYGKSSIDLAEWVKSVLTENLVEEGNSEADVEEMWNDLHEKYKKAAADPRVQEQLKRRAIEHQELMNRYNYDIERTKEGTKDLFQDLVHGENEQDTSLGAMLAMKDLGVLFVPKKGEVAKKQSKKDTQGSLHLKGTMQPDQNYLESLSVDADHNKKGDPAVNLSRMNEAQLGAMYISAIMEDNRDPNGDFNTEDAWSDAAHDNKPHEPGSAVDMVKKALEKKLDTTPAELKHVFKRLREVGQQVADMTNKFNNGLLPGMDKLFDSDEPATKEDVQKIREQIVKEQAERDAILKSQEDDKLAINGKEGLPSHMKGGFWDKPLPDGTTPKPFTWQAQAINWISTAKRGLLAYDMGMGKALKSLEKVMTTEGWRAIGSLKVGDSVFGSDGKPHTVKGVYPQGELQFYKVSFSDGSSVESCDEHLWAVNSPVRKKRGNPNRVMSLRQIMDAGLVDGAGNRKWFIPMVEPVQHSRKKFGVDPYVLGALLGDGYLSSTQIRFCKPDKDFESLFRGKLGVAELVWQEGSSGNCDYWRFNQSAELREELARLDLLGTKSDTKFIPESYKFGSVQQRLELLQGLLDTDGYVDPKSSHIEYVTVSERLAHDVRYLVESLGGTCRIQTKIPTYEYDGESREGQLAYRLGIKLPSEMEPFRLKRKLRNYRPTGKYEPTRAIVAVAPTGVSEGVCIAVDAPDHLYVTKHFILTHNTASVIGATCKLMDEGKIEGSVLVLPPVLMAQWPNEIRTYAPGVKPEEILDLSPYSLEERKLMLKSDIAKKAKFIIMSTGTLVDQKGAPKEGTDGADEGMDNEFIEALNALPNRMVAVDEVHTGGYKTGAENEEDAGVRNRLMGQILKDREYAIGMTGTPMPNAAMDTFNLTDLFAPGKVGKRDQWEGTCATTYDENTGKRTVANQEKMKELRARLKPYVFSKEVTDDDVAPQLEKWLPPPPTQARNPGAEGGVLTPSKEKGANGLSQADYFNGGLDRIAEARIRVINEKREAAGKEPLEGPAAVAIMRLLKVNLSRQAAISPALIDPSYGADAPAPKLDMCVEQIKQHFKGGWGKGGEPVVVFGSTVKSFKLLKRKLKQAGVDVDNMVGEISNETSPEDRGYIQDAANQSKLKIVMVGIKSGGAGLNLQKASNHMIFLDNPWTPADKRQAIGRVQRVQQKKNVLISSFSMDGTYDPIIEEKIANKQVISDALLGEDDTWEDDADKKIKAMLAGHSPKPPKFSQAHDKQFAEIAASMAGGESLDDDLLNDPNLTDVEVNQKARKELSPHLTQEFDRAADRKKWRKDRAEAGMKSRIAGMESLIETMKKQLDPKDPKVKKDIEDLKKRLQNLKNAAGESYAKQGGPKEGAPEKPEKAKEKKEPKLVVKKDKEPKAAKEEKPVKEAKAKPEKAPKEKKEAAPKEKPAEKKPKEKEPEAAAAKHEHKSPIPKLKKHPYKEGSNKKRHGVSEDELATIHGALKNFKGTAGQFMDKVIKPVWEGGDYTREKAMEMYNTWMAAFEKDGLTK